MRPIQDDVLQLPNGATFFNADLLPSKLYVRTAYKDPYSCTSSWRDILVIGNPGVGKSFFALYKLYQLLHDGATIVYECLPFHLFMILTGCMLMKGCHGMIGKLTFCFQTVTCIIYLMLVIYYRVNKE